MAFCRNCGTPVEGQFCAKCGTPAAAAPVADPAQASGQAYAPPAGQPYAPPAAQPAPAAAGLENNVAAALCYLVTVVTGILFLVLAPYNQNKTIRFHAFQSIFFFVACVAISIVFAIFGIVLGTMGLLGFGLLGLWSLLHMVIWLGLFIVWIMLMVKAYQNQKWVLPIIGPLAEKQA
jgi:uncharacterized membrane protein